MTAMGNGGAMTAMAMTAGGSGMTLLSLNTGSTAKTGMAIAPAATLSGTGMTALRNGGRMTAMETMAGGSGIGSSARTAVTTGSPPTNGGDGATATTEQNYFATVHLAAESTCASYLASAIRPSAERMPGGALFIL